MCIFGVERAVVLPELVILNAFKAFQCSYNFTQNMKHSKSYDLYMNGKLSYKKNKKNKTVYVMLNEKI